MLQANLDHQQKQYQVGQIQQTIRPLPELTLPISDAAAYRSRQKLLLAVRRHCKGKSFHWSLGGKTYFGFGPRFRRQGLVARFSDLASNFGEGQTLANYAVHGEIEAVTIINRVVFG